MTWLPDSVRWYATLVILTWGVAPLVRWLCPRLADRGAFVARPLGLLAVVYPSWLLASISPVPYLTVGLWLTVAIVAVAGWGLAFRRGWITRDWLRALLVAEALSLVVFAAFLWFRGYTPRITGTEKPMDSAFLAAGARAHDMPPLDPWLAGERINYYYLGYLLHGSLARMAAVPTWVAFNLALATTFAMALTAAAGFVFTAARTWLTARAAIAAAALGAFLLMIAGNLLAPIRLLQDPSATMHADWWSRIGWQSSRIVVDQGSQQANTINEFPAFSFTLGDLHPHVLALPFTVMALALALNLLLLRRRDDGAGDARLDWLRIALSGAAIGALYPINSWDFPTYLGAAAIAIWFASGWTRIMAKRIGVLVVAAVIAWAPFILTFVPFAGGSTSDLPSWLRNLPVVSKLATTVAAYTGERTAAGEFLTVFGIPWSVAVMFLTVEIARARRSEAAVRIPGVAIATAVIVAIAAIALPAPVLILAGAPFAVAVWRLRQAWGQEASARTVAIGLFAGGFALILITEFFYIQDAFNGRYNTLFKVYFQVWTLFAAGSALAVALLVREAAGRVALQSASGVGVAAIVAAGLVYPIISVDQWINFGNPTRVWQGLDGAAFVGATAPDDLAAIRWLADHAQEGDVVLEAPGCSYRVNFGVPTSELAAFTGVPTVIGWDGHEGQWRGGQPTLLGQIEPRAQDVAAIYANPASPLVDRYGVTLLFVGNFERNGAGGECPRAGPYQEVGRAGYPGPGWTQVFASGAAGGAARIFRRTRG